VGLRALLRGTAPDVQVVGEAGSGAEAVEVARQLRPDVVVLDLDMPGVDGVATIPALLALAPPPRVLIVSMHPEQERLLEALRAGACGYLMKDAAEQELVDAIRVVATGEVYVRPNVARLLAASVREPAPEQAREPHADERLAVLSEREHAGLAMVAEGYSGPEIGARLGISAKTVETYKQRIGEKIGLAHRTDYVRFALDVGLLHR
jgi:DNA-binding NarL/FixJ family response regulator